MTRIFAVIVLTLALGGCFYPQGSTYPQTLGPQGDTPGAVAGD